MKNMKITAKLVTSFMIVIALAILVAGAGIIGMSKMNSADDNLYKNNVVAIESICYTDIAFGRLRMSLLNMIIYEPEDALYEKAVADQKDALTKIDRYVEMYLPTMDENDVEDAKQFGLFQEAYNKLLPLVDEVVSMTARGDNAGASALMSDTINELCDRIDAALIACAMLNHNHAADAVAANTTLYKSMAFVEIAFLAVAIGAALFFAIYVSRLVSKPLNRLVTLMEQVGRTGDLTIPPPLFDALSKDMYVKDEIGMTISAFKPLIFHIKATSASLQAIADGDLSGEISVLSDSDELGKAMQQMQTNLNEMFAEINSATGQVSSGSKQIADGAQALAQGTTEQAAAVQQLSSSMNDIAVKTQANAAMANQAAALSTSIKDNAQTSSAQMDHMMQAVKEINDASLSINRVIKVIDDIAFQTNILALNAAVEAARAGQHGKGFAVVAEEVRSLAGKSAAAAKDTGSLIANSMEKAELGAQIAEETAASLEKIVSGINESTGIINQIAMSSEDQSHGIMQINTGIEQVAQVVQQNSATAQQSAAASQQMSGQSDLLQSLVAQFKLKRGADRLEPGRHNGIKRLSGSSGAHDGSSKDSSSTLGKY